MDDVIVTDRVTPLAPGTSTATDIDGRFQHFAWLDLRGLAGEIRDAYVDAAVHHRIDGIVSEDLALLETLPPTIRRILAPAGAGDASADVDLVLAPTARLADVQPGVRADLAADAIVSDAATLEEACAVVRRVPWTVLTFTDPTKIPLEIVIAAAENSGGRTVTVVTDITDAEIVKIVLEHGSDGLLLAPTSLDDVARLQSVITRTSAPTPLEEFVVESVEHIGMGERACIDTTSLLEKDEGCLIGSFAAGFFLSCSETHKLPYMPTRPFRWNAGAVHSYVLTPDNRTRYVSELRAGQPILAVRTDGTTREVRIGRVKIEKRPLISITAVTADGKRVNVIAQDDWHVRLLGPGATVNNVTELVPGDRLLGYVPSEARHVGLPISEYCLEQ
jgi:3-amino-4-hydroxybenzoic acid synthase